MKKIILILLVALIALVALAGAMTYVLMDDGSDSSDISSEAYQKVSNKVQEVTSSDSGSSGSSNDGGSNIVSELVKSNDQEGGGSYREVNYDDGGFRQYDSESGELIGSSYEEDQEQLGVVDGNLE